MGVHKEGAEGRGHVLGFPKPFKNILNHEYRTKKNRKSNGCDNIAIINYLHIIIVNSKFNFNSLKSHLSLVKTLNNAQCPSIGRWFGTLVLRPQIKINYYCFYMLTT